MARGESVIKAWNLTKTYGSFKAVDDLSFEIYTGDIFGFLEPNGAGKTTTIRMLNGLSKPSSGKATILGFDVAGQITLAKKYIGVVPELSNLYDDLSAIDNLVFMAALYGVPKAERRNRAERLLRLFGLYERRNSMFDTFSRGMKRALTIAAALIHEPKIVFLDEPTVGLDVVAARSLRNIIATLHSQGITIFLTTHYLEEADILCDRIAILVKGRIIKTGTPKSLKDSCDSKCVVDFSFAGEISGLKKELSIKFSGEKLEIKSPTQIRVHGIIPMKIYRAAVEFSAENNIKLESINRITPTLEDAFIKITGLSPIILAEEENEKQPAKR